MDIMQDSRLQRLANPCLFNKNKSKNQSKKSSNLPLRNNRRLPL
ncbi:protein of unknown function [Candidatus Bipolaricaulis anaerobius]|uniref:Uncharacterized protein n=1 Tax=Candidatus Bipolaricaulis anaerobius TaxID=2026885 RepID=A0A2X3KWN0_9BACT|nr:protein of unknown function [Candidatus Bipolaricaulis anaerobius]